MPNTHRENVLMRFGTLEGFSKSKPQSTSSTEFLQKKKKKKTGVYFGQSSVPDHMAGPGAWVRLPVKQQEEVVDQTSRSAVCGVLGPVILPGLPLRGEVKFLNRTVTQILQSRGPCLGLSDVAQAAVRRAPQLPGRTASFQDGPC